MKVPDGLRVPLVVVGAGAAIKARVAAAEPRIGA